MLILLLLFPPNPSCCYSYSWLLICVLYCISHLLVTDHAVLHEMWLQMYPCLCSCCALNSNFQELSSPKSPLHLRPLSLDQPLTFTICESYSCLCASLLLRCFCTVPSAFVFLGFFMCWILKVRDYLVSIKHTEPRMVLST